MYYIGIDLGGTNIKAGVCDENGKILIKDSVKTHVEKGLEYVVDAMSGLALDLVKRQGLTVDDIEYIGVATPGTADDSTGIIVYCSSIPFRAYPLAEKMSEKTGIKIVHIENDANAAAKGEATVGSAKGYNSSLLITLGTGVGGGFVYNGKLFTGCNFAAFEVGHMVINADNGPDCDCSRRGCWEKLASATALERMTREAMEAHRESSMWKLCDGDIANASARTAFIAQREGDKTGDEVVRKYIGYLACGLVNMINILQPEIITIGGGVCNEGKYLLDPLLEIIEREQYSRYGSRKTKIAIASLGNDAGLIGAAMLGR